MVHHHLQLFDSRACFSLGLWTWCRCFVLQCCLFCRYCIGSAPRVDGEIEWFEWAQWHLSVARRCDSRLALKARALIAPELSPFQRAIHLSVLFGPTHLSFPLEFQASAFSSSLWGSFLPLFLSYYILYGPWKIFMAFLKVWWRQ